MDPVNPSEEKCSFGGQHFSSMLRTACPACNPTEKGFVKQERSAPPTSNGMTHELKCAAEFFEAVRDGRKPFEVRVADRPFKLGDILRLREVDLLLNYTGRECSKSVVYILRGWGVEKGHVCMGLTDIVANETAGDQGLYCEQEHAHDPADGPISAAVCLGCWNKLAQEVIELRKRVRPAVESKARVAEYFDIFPATSCAQCPWDHGGIFERDCNFPECSPEWRPDY